MSQFLSVAHAIAFILMLALIVAAVMVAAADRPVRSANRDRSRPALPPSRPAPDDSSIVMTGSGERRH